eukprot:95889-Chlamydomonas_euryale.AAC.1
MGEPSGGAAGLLEASGCGMSTASAATTVGFRSAALRLSGSSQAAGAGAYAGAGGCGGTERAADAADGRGAGFWAAANTACLRAAAGWDAAGLATACAGGVPPPNALTPAWGPAAASAPAAAGCTLTRGTPDVPAPGARRTGWGGGAVAVAAAPPRFLSGFAAAEPAPACPPSPLLLLLPASAAPLERCC